MNLIPLIDTFGEAGTAVFGGAVLGLIFGFAAQRSGFCTRSAVLDLTQKRDPGALATWAVGFAVAVLGVQWLLTTGALEVTDTRFFGTPQSLSGAIFGGLMFGVGMVLTRGCVSRLIVLGASGNLRAIVSVLIVALVGLATYDGVLVPLRNAIGGVWNSAAIGGNDLLAHIELGQSLGLAIGGVLALAAIALVLVSRLSLWRLAGGAMVGATIVGGWYFTWTLSQQVFDPIRAESLSFIRPLATTGEVLVAGVGASLDQGLLAGTLLGAFVAAVAFGDFRIVTFSEPGTPSLVRYAAGSCLMGFGGILAVGCTIGAGFTGGSVLAISSLVGLASMITGAAAADRLLSAGSLTHPVPAE